MASLQAFLMVGAGGAAGAMARFALGRYLLHAVGPGFPWGTLAANVIGAFVMGVLVEFLALRIQLPHTVQLGLTVGLLGGFTTFSAFSLETALMIERHEWGIAAIYVAASVVLCIGALFGGLFITRAAL